MLYLDTAFPIKTNTRRSACGIIIGKSRSCRHLDYMLRLPSSFIGQERLEPGLYRELTIQCKKGGGPIQIAVASGSLFLILTSHLSDDEDFIGNIRIPRVQRRNVISRAVAPVGAGRWETLILKAKKGDAFYINWNRVSGADAVTAFYYVDEYNSVHSCDQSGIPSLFTDLGITPSFTVRDDLDPLVSRIDRREWFKL